MKKLSALSLTFLAWLVFAGASVGQWNDCGSGFCQIKSVVSTSCAPNTLTGLSAWYNANVGVIKVGGGPAGNGDNVLTWQDQSGNSQDATGGGAAGPIYLTAGMGSKPTLHFITANGPILATASATVSTGSVNTGSVFAVGQITSSSPTNGQVLSVLGTGHGNFFDNDASALFGSDTGGTTGIAFYRNADKSVGTVSLSTTHSFGNVLTGSTSTVYVDGAAGTPISSNKTWGALATLFLGNNSQFASFDGLLSEAVLFTTDQTANVTCLNNYFKATWGF